jgi:hypothetical protein
LRGPHAQRRTCSRTRTEPPPAALRRPTHGHPDRNLGCEPHEILKRTALVRVRTLFFLERVSLSAQGGESPLSAATDILGSRSAGTNALQLFFERRRFRTPPM